MTSLFAQRKLVSRAAGPEPPIARWVQMVGLAALALLFAPGCPGPTAPSTTAGSGSADDGYTPDPRGTASLRDNSASLPASSTQATAAISGASGPEGSLFGVQLDDGSKAYVLGTAAGGTDQSLTVTDVVLLDANDNLILHQGIIENGTLVTFATGDAVRLTMHADGRVDFKMTLYATVPPSELVGTYDPATGYVDFFETGSSTSYVLNSLYGGSSASSAALVRAQAKTGKGAARSSLSDLSCETIGNGLVSAITLACDVRSLMTRKLPERAINAMGVGAQRAFETYKDPDHPLTVKVAAYAKWSITIICEGLKAGIGIANVFTSLNPFDLGCYVLNVVDEGVQAGSGESLADKICDLLTGGEPADDEEDAEDNGDGDTGGGTSTGDGPWQIVNIEVDETTRYGDLVVFRVYWTGPSEVPPGMTFFVDPVAIPGLDDPGCPLPDHRTYGAPGSFEEHPWVLELDTCDCGGGAFSYRIGIVDIGWDDWSTYIEHSSMVISGTCPDYPPP